MNILDFDRPNVFSLAEQYGRRATSDPLTEEQHRYLRDLAKVTSGRRRSYGEWFEPRQCFHSAMMLTYHDANMRHRIRYVEGSAMTGLFPVHHAWVELDGKTVDLTRSLRGEEATADFFAGRPPQADLLDRVLGVIPDGWEYIGIRFPAEEVLAYIDKHAETSSLISNFRTGFCYLSGAKAIPQQEGNK